MQSLERTAVDEILSTLNKTGWLFPEFDFYMVKNRPKLLGYGGFSAVYEMINKERPDIHYALKVSGFEKHTHTSLEFWNTTRIQGILSQDSPFIVRTIYGIEILVNLDENGSITTVESFDDIGEENWNKEDDNRLHLQCLLMEKLDVIVEKDRFNKTELKKEELLSESNVIQFAMEVGQALMFAHDYGVLHRDVKLENIFWDKEEQSYKLGDFGIAKYTGGDNAETIVYTDGYGAPEIERHLKDYYNLTADIYSFGITLYLLLNDLKFPGSEGYYSRTEIQYNPEYVFPAPINASERMTSFIRKMCSYHPEDRYQFMGELLMDLAYLGMDEGLEGAEEILDLANAATETYREEQRSEESTEEELKEINEEEKPKTRAERKKEKQIFDLVYRDESIKFLTAITILLVLLFKGMQVDTSVITNNLFWILPIGLLVESLFQKIKEFHLIFGAALVLLTGLSIYSIGLTMPHIIVLLFTIIGIAGLSLAGSLGFGLWIVLELTQIGGFLNFLGNHDLGWILLIVLLITVDRFFCMRRDWKHTTYIRAFLGVFIFDKMFLVMTISGIVLFILQKCNVLVVPKIIQRMHFIPTGIICFIALVIFVWWDGELDDELDEQDLVSEEGTDLEND